MNKFLIELLGPLKPTHRRSVGILILLSFASMLLLLTGVGMLLPLIAVIVEENVYEEYQWVGLFGDLIGRPERSTLVFLGVSFFVIFMCCRGALSLWILSMQKRLGAKIKVSISDALFDHFLAKSYLFFRRENSAKILRSLTSDVRSHIACLDAGIVLVGDSMVAAALITLMALVDLKGLLLFSVFIGLFTLGYFQTLHPRIRNWGKQARKENAALVKHVNQAVGGIKEIKVLHKERAFHEVFVKSIYRLTDAQRKFSIGQGIPPLALELMATVAIAVLLAGVVIQGKTLESMLPALGVFAVSVIKLTSMLGRLTGAIQAIRFNYPGLLALNRIIRESQNTNTQERPQSLAQTTLTSWQTLELRNVSLSYGTGRSFSLKNVDLTIHRGEAVGIFGESGSGKSTLADLILGLHEDFGGTITIDDHELSGVRVWWQSEIGYVPQSVYILDDTLIANIALGVEPDEVDEDRMSKVIDQAQLTSFVSSLEHGISTGVGERGFQISGGQQQRVGIARALYRNPSVLILDEATSALDSNTEGAFMETIASMRGSVTMIVIAHRLSTLKYCDRVIQLAQGELVKQGTYQELIGDS